MKENNSNRTCLVTGEEKNKEELLRFTLTPDRRVGRPVGRGRFRRSALEGGLFFRSDFRTSGVGRPLFGRPLFVMDFGLGRSGFGRRFPGDLGGCGPVFVVSVGINLFGHG